MSAGHSEPSQRQLVARLKHLLALMLWWGTSLLAVALYLVLLVVGLLLLNLWYFGWNWETVWFFLGSVATGYAICLMAAAVGRRM